MNDENGMSKVLSGFLIGVGFTLALVMGLWGYEYLSNKLSGPSYLDESAGVVVKSFREIEGEHGMNIVGVVVNTGESSWRYIDIEAHFYNKNGELADEWSSTLDGVLEPDEKAPFKIKCGNKSYPLSEYDSYKVVIVDGYKAE